MNLSWIFTEKGNSLIASNIHKLLYQKDQLKQKTASEEEESEGSEQQLTGLGDTT